MCVYFYITIQRVFFEQVWDAKTIWQPLFTLWGYRDFVKIPFRIAWANHYCLCYNWQCLSKGYIITGDRRGGDRERKGESVKGGWDWRQQAFPMSRVGKVHLQIWRSSCQLWLLSPKDDAHLLTKEYNAILSMVHYELHHCARWTLNWEWP